MQDVGMESQVVKVVVTFWQRLTTKSYSRHAIMNRTCNSSFRLLGMASHRSVFHLSYFLMLHCISSIKMNSSGHQ